MLIDVSDLVFEYPGFRALKDISFSIPAGSITALVGPNGAGKTTLLRCMSALEQPLNGSIIIDGINTVDYPRQCHRKIGYLSDFFGLYDRLTIRQCLHYVARAQGLDTLNCEEAIVRVSQQLNIADRLDSTPAELSRGLRQRVAIAQAIIHQPKVVLLDEPASGLDPEARHLLAELFLQLQQQGMTIIVSSHILAELEAYCSDMLVLRAGRIVEQVAIKHKVEQLKEFKLVLTHSVSNLEPMLSSIDCISRFKIHANQVIFSLRGDINTQHECLKILLKYDLPVCEFSPVSINLQDAYLATVKNES